MKLFSTSCLVAVLFAGSAMAAPLSAASDPLAFGPENVKPSILVSAPHGMVVSAQHLASQVGADILKQGGNAVDAAVAVGYAMAVVYPAAGSLGGGGFMTLYLGHRNNNPGPGLLRHHRTVFVDFRERAPLNARPDMFVTKEGQLDKEASVKGWKAVAVPGTVAGLEGVRARWGRLSRAKDMAPAIKLAREGFILEKGDVELLRTGTSYFHQDPYARSIFLRPDGQDLQVGDRLVQTNLANSLGLISRYGQDAFYNGLLAGEILKASSENGGILTGADFSSYQMHLQPSLKCTYRGYDIHTAPPPSGGGVALCEMLNILQGYNLSVLGLRSVPAIQHELEAMRHAYSDRRDLGDPSFVKNPVGHLTDIHYADEVRRYIPDNRAIDSTSLKPGQAEAAASQVVVPQSSEKKETTHFSVIDKHGMAVSVTYTLNGWFGAGVMAGNTGIWMNDEMDDFAAKPGEANMFGIVGSQANAIAPGKAPLSSMSPTIITKGKKVVAVLGSPGGSRIPTILLHNILGLVDYNLDLRQAVDLPRFHEQWLPSVVEMEPGAFPLTVQQELEREGYQFVRRSPWGMMEGIIVGAPALNTPQTGLVYGVADPRHPGGAAIGE
ncbi:gamma-glutamyltransferase [Aristophania vespae]|uniref:gamma-glutamyltransferase n=1 Tax=Aristophania vespae TaxID=2697033 RepID=UPI0023518731|nr:gamma-glutamyltransferase [Aristophania vespae]UMM64250.1 Glutathione hydrolase proenzyme [Aristophania vespae]